MMNIDLNWYQRVVLWMRIGAMPAPNLKDAAVLLRILEKIRPSDAEQQETQLSVDGGNYRWQLPTHRYGDKHIELENEEAKALGDGLDNHPLPVLVADAAWMLELLSRLRPAATQVVENAA